MTDEYEKLKNVWIHSIIRMDIDNLHVEMLASWFNSKLIKKKEKKKNQQQVFWFVFE